MMSNFEFRSRNNERFVPIYRQLYDRSKCPLRLFPQVAIIYIFERNIFINDIYDPLGLLVPNIYFAKFSMPVEAQFGFGS